MIIFIWCRCCSSLTWWCHRCVPGKTSGCALWCCKPPRPLPRSTPPPCRRCSTGYSGTGGPGIRRPSPVWAGSPGRSGPTCSLIWRDTVSAAAAAAAAARSLLPPLPPRVHSCRFLQTRTADLLTADIYGLGFGNLYTNNLIDASVLVGLSLGRKQGDCSVLSV